MTTTYQSNISNARWIVDDILGNIGWIMYIAGLILSFITKPKFMDSGVLFGIMILSVIPALLIVVGIIELVSERIKELDRVLSKARLYRGFGGLTFAGILGFIISLSGIIYGILFNHNSLLYLWIMFIGSLLLAIFGGLLFIRYKKI